MNHTRVQKIEQLYQTKKTNQFNLKAFALPIPGQEGVIKGLACRPANLYNSYFYEEEVPKEKIALHFTAGHLQGDLSVLSQRDWHVSVAFVIARDGTIYQLHPSKYWAFHLGPDAKGGNKPMSQQTIGIELSNYGPLIPRDGNMETTYSKANSKDIYCSKDEEDKFVHLSEPYRGHQYYASYTDVQYDQLILLLKYLGATYEIPMDFLPEPLRYTTTPKVKDFKGILSHVNFRKDKMDIGPAFDWDRVIEGVKVNVTKHKIDSAIQAFDHIEEQLQILQVKIWDSPIENKEDMVSLLNLEDAIERAYDAIQTLHRTKVSSPTPTSYDTVDALSSEDEIEASFSYVRSRSVAQYGEEGPEEQVYNPMDYKGNPSLINTL